MNKRFHENRNFIWYFHKKASTSFNLEPFTKWVLSRKLAIAHFPEVILEEFSSSYQIVDIWNITSKLTHYFRKILIPSCYKAGFFFRTYFDDVCEYSPSVGTAEWTWCNCMLAVTFSTGSPIIWGRDHKVGRTVFNSYSSSEIPWSSAGLPVIIDLVHHLELIGRVDKGLMQHK